MRKFYSDLRCVRFILLAVIFFNLFDPTGTIFVGRSLAAEDSSPAPIFEEPERYELEVTLNTPLNRGITLLTTIQRQMPFKMTTTNGSVKITMSGKLQNPFNGRFPLKLIILENNAPISNEQGSSNYVLKLDEARSNEKTISGVVSFYWIRLSPQKPTGYSRVINDQPITPLVYHDAPIGNYYYVESDGRHVCAFTQTGKILWWRDPFTDSGLQPYRVKRPVITYIGPSDSKSSKDKFIGIGFNSSQFGDLDTTNGDFRFRGQD